MKLNFLDELKSITFKEANTDKMMTLENQCVVGNTPEKVVLTDLTDNEVMGQRKSVFLDKIISVEKM